mgnify:CR=1 FL=1
MLFYLQDTNNKYVVMEADPMGSKDVMYGVPAIFKDILDEVAAQVEMLRNPGDSAAHLKQNTEE